MTDPLDALRAGIEPVDPDPTFAARLRERLRAALLETAGGTVSTPTNAQTTQDFAPGPALSPYIIVSDGRAALDWYVRVFGAVRRGEPYVMADGSIGHAELAIGDALLMLAEGVGDTSVAPPGEQLPSHTLHLQVSDVDDTVRLAEANGALVQRRPADQPYGRGAAIVDPFGHRWLLLRPTGAARPRGHGDVGYLTIVVPNDDVAREFYGAVLGWEFTPGRVERGWNVPGVQPMTGLRGDPDAPPGAQLVYQVSDMDTALAAVRANGGIAGTASREPYGQLAECRDNQGIQFSLWQPK